MPPASGLCLPSHHGQPRSPGATLVGGRGSGYRSNPGRSRHDSCGSLLKRPQLWGDPIDGEVFSTGDPLLPGAAGVGGGSCPWPVAGDIGQIRPILNGASNALAILRPGQHIFDQPTYVYLPG